MVKWTQELINRSMVSVRMLPVVAVVDRIITNNNNYLRGKIYE
jgi:hypothetical protein